MDKPETSDANVKKPNYKSSSLNSDHGRGLTSGFWKNFAESVWEKETFAQRKDCVTPPISEEELFKCVVEMSIKHCEIVEAGGDKTEVRIYVKNIEVKKDYPHLFPRFSDENFAGYSKRVSKELDGQPFAFVIDEITMPLSLRAWTHSFLKGMYRPLKTISNGHMWSIFFGDYSTTPYGVHDHATIIYNESAFYFPIVGEKEMTTWRPSYVDDNPGLKGAHFYSDHADASTQLLAEPRGMMYWPSNRWHIGSSGGGDVSIVLAIRVLGDIYPMFLHSIVNLEMLSPYKPSGIRAKLCELAEGFLFVKHMFLLRYSARARRKQVNELPFDPDDLQGSAREIPEDLQKLGRRLIFRLYFGENIEKVMSIFWLFHLTNFGFGSRSVASSPISLEPELQIRRSPGIALLWRQVDNETIIFVADGWALEMPALFLPMVEFIAATQIGQEVFYEELVDSVSKQKIPSHELEKQLSQLLKLLGESGTFLSSR